MGYPKVMEMYNVKDNLKLLLDDEGSMEMVNLVKSPAEADTNRAGGVEAQNGGPARDKYLSGC